MLKVEKEKILEMSDKPVISVVIATYNRRDTLKITLEKLAALNTPASEFEVIVVDDGSTDGTMEMAEALTISLPYELRCLHHENHGPGFTQNRGINDAKSNLILLIADDIWPTERLLDQHLETHKEHPEENIAVLGKVLQSPDLPPTVMHKYWNPFRYDRFEGKKQLDGINFLACNISVKKSFLLQNGMYKERPGVAHEDIELGYRLKEKGLRIIYNEDALAYHYHCESLPKACKRAYERGWNFDMISENIPKSFIFPLYHICSLKAGCKAFLRMLPREIPRIMFFNKWSVCFFWRPILQLAENNSMAASFANSFSYRGVMGYYQRKGYRDMQKKQRSHV